MEHGSSDADGGTVVLDVPAEARSLRLLRLAAADAAAACGYELDRVEAARLVVDELSSVLISEGAGARMRISIGRPEGGPLVLEGRVDAGDGGPPQVDLIVRELLDASVGRQCWAVANGSGALTFRAELGPRRVA